MIRANERAGFFRIFRACFRRSRATASERAMVRASCLAFRILLKFIFNLILRAIFTFKLTKPSDTCLQSLPVIIKYHVS